MDWVKQEYGLGEREYGLGKGRVWTGYSDTVDRVKRECGLYKTRVWIG